MSEESKLLAALAQFQEKGLYCDANLESVEGQLIPIHACLLGAKSSHLHWELTQGKEFIPGTVIKLPFVASAITELVSYIYSSRPERVASSLRGSSDTLLSILNTLGIEDNDINCCEVEEMSSTDNASDRTGSDFTQLDASRFKEKTERTSVSSEDVNDDLAAAERQVNNPGEELAEETKLKDNSMCFQSEDSTKSTEIERNDHLKEDTVSPIATTPSVRRSSRARTPKKLHSDEISLLLKPVSRKVEDIPRTPTEARRSPPKTPDKRKKGAPQKAGKKSAEPKHEQKSKPYTDNTTKRGKHCSMKKETPDVDDDEGEIVATKSMKLKAEKVKEQPAKAGTLRGRPSQSTHRKAGSKVCTYCGKTFSQYWHRMRHERIHTGEKPYQCQYCDMKFTRVAHKKRHENVHTKEVIFQCRFCGKTFGHQSQLYYHETVHNAKGKFKCTYCDKSFPFRNSLDSHLRCHSGEKPFQCVQCGKNFSTKSVLTDHERAHRGEKRFACSYCPAKFVRHSEQTAHERVHTGERPHKCRLCQKLFRTQSQRREHERTHPEFFEPAADGDPGKSKAGFELLQKKPKTDKPHVHACTICGKKFAKNCLRLRHERSHTGEKPYKCSVCGKSFKDLWHKKRHEQVHQGDTDFSGSNLVAFSPEEAQNFITCIKEEIDEDGQHIIHIQEANGPVLAADNQENTRMQIISLPGRFKIEVADTIN